MHTPISLCLYRSHLVSASDKLIDLIPAPCGSVSKLVSRENKGTAPKLQHRKRQHDRDWQCRAMKRLTKAQASPACCTGRRGCFHSRSSSSSEVQSLSLFNARALFVRQIFLEPLLKSHQTAHTIASSHSCPPTTQLRSARARQALTACVEVLHLLD